MFVISNADTAYNADVKCIPIHLGFESCVVYNTVSILATSYMGDVRCIAHKNECALVYVYIQCLRTVRFTVVKDHSIRCKTRSYLLDMSPGQYWAPPKKPQKLLLSLKAGVF